MEPTAPPELNLLESVNAMTGSASLPRRNGHLAFDVPWQGRAFGLALALTQRLGMGWEPFRQRLIREISAVPDRPYWHSWVAATEGFATEHGLVDGITPVTKLESSDPDIAAG